MLQYLISRGIKNVGNLLCFQTQELYSYCDLENLKKTILEVKELKMAGQLRTCYVKTGFQKPFEEIVLTSESGYTLRRRHSAFTGRLTPYSNAVSAFRPGASSTLTTPLSLST